LGPAEVQWVPVAVHHQRLRCGVAQQRFEAPERDRAAVGFRRRPRPIPGESGRVTGIAGGCIGAKHDDGFGSGRPRRTAVGRLPTADELGESQCPQRGPAGYGDGWVDLVIRRESVEQLIGLGVDGLFERRGIFVGEGGSLRPQLARPSERGSVPGHLFVGVECSVIVEQRGGLAHVVVPPPERPPRYAIDQLALSPRHPLNVPRVRGVVQGTDVLAVDPTGEPRRVGGSEVPSQPVRQADLLTRCPG
jgi:hypothetical protein